MDTPVQLHTCSAPMRIDDQWHSNKANQDATTADGWWWGLKAQLILTCLVKITKLNPTSFPVSYLLTKTVLQDNVSWLYRATRFFPCGFPWHMTRVPKSWVTISSSSPFQSDKTGPSPIMNPPPLFFPLSIPLQRFISVSVSWWCMPGRHTHTYVCALTRSSFWHLTLFII